MIDPVTILGDYIDLGSSLTRTCYVYTACITKFTTFHLKYVSRRNMTPDSKTISPGTSSEALHLTADFVVRPATPP